MNIILASINSKYIHSALAPWYLKAACKDDGFDINIMEFTINDQIDNIIQKIYLKKPGVLAFSCYIWNIEIVLKISPVLKKLIPELKIIYGGPEVSFDIEELMLKNSFIDFVILGEGERPFSELVKALEHSNELSVIAGLAYRDKHQVIINPSSCSSKCMSELYSPFTDEMLASIKNRIVYYEASRGCPYSCSYCLSSTTEGVKYMPLERVKEELSKLVELGVSQIKFVDRTFNANRQKAYEILDFIINQFGSLHHKINFHFEVAADLFNDELLNLVSTAPKGLIQFEIGIQTTNEKTLECINRKTNIKVVFENVKKLLGFGNVHVHVDLIAGLPHEDFKSFKNSFNEVYLLKAHQLQLGFLKMLRGSQIRKEAEKYDYVYKNYPPYEILSNKFIGYDELLLLKGVEELVDRYYNSLRFVNSLEFIITSCFDSPFDFYYDFNTFLSEKKIFEKSISSRELYNILYSFCEQFMKENQILRLNELLKLDFLSTDNTNNLPQILTREFDKSFRNKCFEFLRNEGNINKYLPQFIGIPSKQIIKEVHFEEFNNDFINFISLKDYENEYEVILFDYSQKDQVSGLFRRHIVKFE